MRDQKKVNPLKKIFQNVNLQEYRSIPFWSWNDKLDKEKLVDQIKWMKGQGMGGYFMHARTGLLTEYLSDEWFECIKACIDAGNELGMDSWVYDENGWPSGFVGGKLLEDPENTDKYLTYTIGDYDKNSFVSYRLDLENLQRVDCAVSNCNEYLNVFVGRSISTADVLNPTVVDKFLELTHNEYKKRLGDKFASSLKGFFTDEPQYFRAKQPYTDMIDRHFKEVYNEDILDKLGLLFVEKVGYREFRYRFWKGMQSLLVNNYAKRVYDWCVANGKEFTGHYIEERHLTFQMLCCGGIMPLYEYETIPGIDHLGKNILTPVGPKQVSSVARQLGKKRVLTESFACCGWDATPTELKRVLEWQFVNGVNLLCQHLVPYTERNQGKRDHPVHFSKANPWIREDFKTFNEYFARLGCLLGESKEFVNVALFCPIRSVYFDYKRELFGKVQSECDISYCNLSQKLSDMNIPYHIIDESIMEKYARIENGKLVVGDMSYEYIVFPKTLTMDKHTKVLFDEFVKNGGKMLFTDGVPTYLEGNECEYNYQTNTSFEEMIDSQPYKISDLNTSIQSTFREINGNKYIFVVNLSKTDCYDVEFSGEFNSFVSCDLESFETSKVSTKLHFEPYQSYVLFLSNDEEKDIEPKNEFSLSGDFEVVNCDYNSLTLDQLEYSFDGVNYSELLPHMGVFNILLEKRYQGELYLRYPFIVKSKPSKLFLLAEDMNNYWCEVNGCRVSFDAESELDSQIYKADISNCVIEGRNEAVVKINFFENDEVYFVLFGKNVTEGLKNKLAYPTTIEPCYLQGDFGVFAETGFNKGEKPNVLRANGFYIDKPLKVVGELTSSGYPFFSGSVTLKKKVIYKDGCSILKLNGRFCLSEVKINGKTVNKSYFSNKVDISNYLKKGENDIEVTLWSGNRNLFGPHHCLDEEPSGVGPYTFEVKGTWKNGKSSEQLDDYAFVKFGLFD